MTDKANDQTPEIRKRRLQDRDWVSPEKLMEEELRYTAKITAAEAARDAAIARFEAQPDAKYGFHLHHEILIEKIRGDNGQDGIEGAKERIAFIMQGKRLDELEPRLRLMRPIPNDMLPAEPDWAALETAAKAKLDAARAEYDKYKVAPYGGTKKSAFEMAYYDVISAPTQKTLDKLMTVGTEFVEAYAKMNEATAAKTQAAKELTDVQTRWLPFSPEQIAELHAKVCEPDCPWDGKSIFPKI